MSKINLSNYEAFYLDFLEGNLGEDDTVLLHNFLESHPQLQVEKEKFVSIDPGISTLELSFKSHLKTITFNETKITSENAEQFLIAAVEGLLSERKEKALRQFISANPSWLTEQEMYSNTKLSADLNSVFNPKNSLKQNRKTIYLPLLLAGIAASIAGLFFLLNTTKTILETDGKAVVSETIVSDSLAVKVPKEKRFAPHQLKQETYRFAQTNTPKTQTSQIQTFIQAIDSSNTVKPNSEIKNEIESNSTFLSNKGNEMEKNNVTQTILIAKQSKENQDKNYVSLAFNDMSNPIQPITSRLGTAIKKEIDFRTAKPSKHTSGGFYLKIGKLEVSHQKH
ncbi:MAG: hypothetical protein RL265_1484 [Bacteroidota bacterium]